MILVQQVLETARRRLATLSPWAGVCEAAAILTNAVTPLIVVCDRDEVALGVISRTDVIKTLVNGKVSAPATSAAGIMTRAVLASHVNQPLQDVWQSMNTRSLRCVPILDDNGRPQGVLHARDVATALLEEVTYEEILLRDYVMGVGYQ
jgi:CBS domain-containing protein